MRLLRQLLNAAGKLRAHIAGHVGLVSSVLALLLAEAAWSESVINSVHNLSVNGPGTIKAVSESDACVFCHTVHRSNGATPLWNHNGSGVTNYIVYSSPTLAAMGLTIPQPNGSSRLCLSCHDGTVALGDVSSRTTPIAMQLTSGGQVTTMPAGTSNLGTDLSGDHPISFVYDSDLAAKDPQLKDPATLVGPVRLDSEHRLQCTACHDPHNDQFGKFLVMDNTGSALCLTCHDVVNWSGSAHAMSSQVAPSATATTLLKMMKSSQVSAVSPAVATAQTSSGSSGKTIAANGCGNCHTPHGAGGKQQLMKFAKPEQNCLPCHNGRSGTKNVAADFQKASAHPITDNSLAHDHSENVVNPSVRHVTCADCHNPHSAAKSALAPARTSQNALGVPGVSATGAVVREANRQQELCFRCHGDSTGRGPARIHRQFVETNTRLQFAGSSGSFHPVETSGRNANVPSLLAPWTTTSTMSCTDCHNSDQSPAAGGAGANGPHGSAYAPLLERRLVTTDFSPETPSSYALCYKCHSRDSILSDRSFRAVNGLGQDRGHRFHIAEAKAACTTCHESHGVAGNQKLINFNLDYVKPSVNGRLEFISAGTASGNCSLICHGKDHNNAGYPGQLLALPRGATLKRR